jgi:hypothetical protein
MILLEHISHRRQRQECKPRLLCWNNLTTLFLELTNVVTNIALYEKLTALTISLTILIVIVASGAAGCGCRVISTILIRLDRLTGSLHHWANSAL